MFEKVLPKNAKQSLGILAESRILKSAYLAGGTALALHIGHRYSYDFDFFTPQRFNEEILIRQLADTIPNFSLERRGEGTIIGYLGKTRFSLFLYDYPLLFKTHPFSGINIADIKDIVPMKIAAIADRGTKRDFIDLYFIFVKEKIVTLKKAIALYDKKFKALNQNKMHIIKSLVYFEDAEKDELPQMIKPINWSSVKRFFVEEQKKVFEEIL